MSLVVFPAVSNLTYAGCFLFSLNCKPTRGLGVHVTFPKLPFPLVFCQFEKWEALKYSRNNWRPEEEETPSVFPPAWLLQERKPQLSLALPAPAEPNSPPSSGPKCQYQPFRAPKLLVSHFPFCSLNPGLKGNNYFFLNMLVFFLFSRVALLLFNFLSSKFLGVPWWLGR